MSLRITDPAMLQQLVERGLLPAAALPTAAVAPARNGSPAAGQKRRADDYGARLDALLSQRWRRWTATAEGDYVLELVGAIPGRSFRLDAAFPRSRLAVELDGFTDHGKNLEAFVRDRERDMLLWAHGWAVIRLATRHLNDPTLVLNAIDRALHDRPCQPARVSFVKTYPRLMVEACGCADHVP